MFWSPFGGAIETRCIYIKLFICIFNIQKVSIVSTVSKTKKFKQIDIYIYTRYMCNKKGLNKLNVNKVSPCATADAIALAAGPEDAADGCLSKGDLLAPAWGTGGHL